MQTANTTPQRVYNLFILDESGSMESIRQSTVRSFNELVQTMRDAEAASHNAERPQQHFVSLYVFNTSAGTREVLFHAPVQHAAELTDQSYRPNSGTPLYDAMGHALHRHEAALRDQTDTVTLVTILTDGEENSSREFTGEAIKALVERLKAAGWVFTYIGTDHDVERFAHRMSIGSSMSYLKTDRDIDDMLVREKKARMKFYERSSSKVFNPARENDLFYKDEPGEDEEEKKNP